MKDETQANGGLIAPVTATTMTQGALADDYPMMPTHSSHGHEDEDNDGDEVASIDRPPSVSSKIRLALPAAKVHHPFSPHVLALLLPASIFGVLARLGLQALVGYEGRAIFPLAWVQAAGCLVMGFGLGLKEPFGQFYGPLYTAMTTGFCGSLTTFSGWQVDVFQSWLNINRDHRDWLRDVIDGLSKTVFTVAISISSLQFGKYVAAAVRRGTPKGFELKGPGRGVRYCLTAVSVLCYAGVYPAYFRLSAGFRHEATAALLFCVPGTLTRYVLSIKLNGMVKGFAVGTFGANMTGTALLGIFRVVQGVGENGPSMNACGLLQGLSDGYCGCLTTVSTFAAELVSLGDGRDVWVYGVVSWVCGQCLLLVVFGVSFWAFGVSEHSRCVYH